MSSPEAGQGKKPFNPADIYAPLTRPSAEKEILGALVEQVSPLLPTRVLRPGERERRIDIIGSIMLQLRLRYARVLDRNGFPRLADEVTENNFLMDIASICSSRNIPDLDKRQRIKKELASIRDFYDAEILNVLGFLHQNIFSSPEGKPPDAGPQLSLFQQAPSGRTPLLQHSFPSCFPVSGISEPTAAAHSLACQSQAALMRLVADQPHIPEELPSGSRELRQIIERLRDGIAALQSPIAALRQTTDALQQYGAYERLAKWINNTNHDAAVEVREAYKYLRTLLKLAAPSGPNSQSHGPISDYSTRSIVELIGFTLDGTQQIRRRFEAMRLLEWSIGFFSVERNPVFKAMRLISKQINATLTGEIFDKDGILLPMDVTKEADELTKENAKRIRTTIPSSETMMTMEDAFNFLIERVRRNLKEHNRKRADESSIEWKNRRIILKTIADGLEKAVEEALLIPKKEKTPVILRGRKLSDELRNILNRGAEKGVINPEYADCVIFDGREKDKESLVRKIFLMQLLVQRAKATLAGHDAGMSSKEARKILKQYAQRMRDSGKKDADIALKPVGFDALDDHVGISFTVKLAKSLKAYKSRAERADVDDIFSQFGLEIANRLGLKNARIKNFLWKNNSANKKSSPDYRVYKVHADCVIETEVFDPDSGNSKIEPLTVPVEIQLLPVETYLRTFNPGDASTIEYEYRKARDLAIRIHPKEIAGREMFPQVFDTRHFADVLSQIA